MNEVQQFYLKIYGAIGTIGHYLKNAWLEYVSWKYWHSAMLHGTVLAPLVAYEFYREVCEVTLASA
eukprot:9694403-Ditylum_brightwellii.AAC.2